MCCVSVVLLHGDEGGDVASANGARLLLLDEQFATPFADAEVTARHNQSVLLLGKADEALCIWVLVLDRLLALLGSFLRGHSVN